MANDPSPPPPRAGLSLYANLLDPANPASSTISAPAVSYNSKSDNVSDQDDAAKKQQAIAASLRFQPTKRPQVAAQKAKAKAIASKFAIPPPPSAAVQPPPPSTNVTTATVKESPSAPAPQKSTLADWTATASDDEDVNNFYSGQRQRGGRKKRKKNKQVELVQDWDDIYDPTRPNNYDDYKNSEEKIREVREWKDLLYRHRMRHNQSTDPESDDDDRPLMNRQFAPPGMSFAPPSNLNNDKSPPPPPPPVDLPDDPTGEDAYARRLRHGQNPPPPPAETPDDPTGDHAYARRMRLSQIPPPPPSPPPTTTIPTPTPPPAAAAAAAAGQISRAPVRYSLPSAPPEIPATEEELAEKIANITAATDEAENEQLRSSRPGQAGFAERLLAKYGWTKGQGLGAKGTGIVNPLYAKADKRKKKSDAEGGGFVTPANTGKILGGNKSKSVQEEEVGKFGAMSEVVRLQNMLTGLDLDEELNREEGGIMQEIGEECGEKYGSVQRVYIYRPTTPSARDDGSNADPVVFVQFTSQLSALRAVNALEGRVFNGNTITAQYWSKEKFEADEYV